MERLLNVTDARSQLPKLVKEVTSNGHQIVITTLNEPKAIITGHAAFQRSQRLMQRAATLYLNDLVDRAQKLIEETQESCQGAGESEMYLFLKQFNPQMRDAWEIAEKISEPHSSLAFAMFTISEIYLSIENYPSLKHLSPIQLNAITDALIYLKCKDLSMEEVGKADFQMMQAGIQTMFPLYVEGDLNALYI